MVESGDKNDEHRKGLGPVPVEGSHEEERRHTQTEREESTRPYALSVDNRCPWSAREKEGDRSRVRVSDTCRLRGHESCACRCRQLLRYRRERVEVREKEEEERQGCSCPGLSSRAVLLHAPRGCLHESVLVLIKFQHVFTAACLERTGSVGTDDAEGGRRQDVDDFVRCGVPEGLGLGSPSRDCLEEDSGARKEGWDRRRRWAVVLVFLRHDR